jgi:hypothetical protein
MYHYTYLIKFENNMKYIGVRSCKVHPSKDSNYLGSSKVIPAELYATCRKRILRLHKTRVEAIAHEIELHNRYNVAVNPKFYNQAKQTSTKFDMSGCRKETHKHVQAMVDKLTGRTAKDYQYIENATKIKRTLRGANRTTKQLEADKQLVGKGKPNPAKGNSGSNSPKFKPWYYITPDYRYIEVHTSIRKYCTEIEPTWSKSTVVYAMLNKEHEVVQKGMFKGYTFGYLHTKPGCITQDNILLALELSKHVSLPNTSVIYQPNRPNLINNITGKD